MSPLAKRIKRLRRDSGLSQTDLANRLHLTPQSVQQWEAGVTTPRGKNLERLAKVLGVAPASLMFGGSETPGDATRSVPVFSQDAVPAKANRAPAMDSAPDDARWITPPTPVGPLAFALSIEDPYLAPVVAPGEVVIVEPDRKPGHLSLVAVREGGRTFVLQYHKVGKRTWAESLSGANAICMPAPVRSVVGVVTSKLRLFE